MKFSRVSPEFDATDRAILELLQENCKQPLAAIGAKVGLKAPSVIERIHKLEEAGVITGYAALLDARRLGRFRRHLLVALALAAGEPRLDSSVSSRLVVVSPKGFEEPAARARPSIASFGVSPDELSSIVGRTLSLSLPFTADGQPGVAGTSGTSPAEYPFNPAGSTDDIAGLVDATGRIFGLMPHPERNVDPWHRPGWTRRTGEGASGPAVGLGLFRNAVEYLRG